MYKQLHKTLKSLAKWLLDKTLNVLMIIIVINIALILWIYSLEKAVE